MDHLIVSFPRARWRIIRHRGFIAVASDRSGTRPLPPTRRSPDEDKSARARAARAARTVVAATAAAARATRGRMRAPPPTTSRPRSETTPSTATMREPAAEKEAPRRPAETEALARRRRATRAARGRRRKTQLLAERRAQRAMAATGRATGCRTSKPCPASRAGLLSSPPRRGTAAPMPPWKARGTAACGRFWRWGPPWPLSPRARCASVLFGVSCASMRPRRRISCTYSPGTPPAA